MQRWFERLREVVARSNDPEHAAVARWFDDWTGGADATSVAYRVTRYWRSEVTTAVYDEGLLRTAREGSDASGCADRTANRSCGRS